MRPHVYTLPAGLSFIDILASGLLTSYGRDRLALGDVRILLPTRRSVRALRGAFLRLSGGEAMILPAMQAIGDVDEEEMTLGGSMRDTLTDDPALLPAIAETRRQFILTRLIQTWCRKRGVGSNSLSQAMMLAKSLARFLDQAETAEAGFNRLKELVPEDYAAHWQITLEFLDIVGIHWPAILKAEGFVGPAERRVKLLRRLAVHLKDHPPQGPVIAAGSTGSIPATGDLLKTIARLPNGQVILPGLDIECDEASWDALGETHPQYAMKRLLDRIGMGRGEVDIWPLCSEKDAASDYPRERCRAIAEALRPAEQLAAWCGMKFNAGKSFENLSWIDCQNRHEEAGVVALIMRQALETPGQTAALVTADRTLARWVTAELARWDIRIDDSAGQPLANTPPAVYLRLLADAVASRFAPVPFLAFLKHPLCSGGMEKPAFRRLVRKLERDIYRGPRPAGGLQALEKIIRADPEIKQRLRPFLSVITELKKLERLFSGRESLFRDLLTTHIEAAEALAGTGTLWQGPAGDMLAVLIAEAGDHSAVLPKMESAAYPGFFDAFLAGQVVRPAYSQHSRLFIWGTLEARLQQADVMILGGLNEGSWPPEAPADPWMSQPMRKAFGVPSADWRIGQSAHDFVAALGAPRVFLTRAEKIDGTPTVKSRWLSRIAALTGLKPHQGRGGPWRTWFASLDQPQNVRPARPPAPRPPLAARPKILSVTGVELWMRDPYALYARDVLRLKALDPIDAEPGAADRGNFIHEALEEFVKRDVKPDQPDALTQLLALGKQAFGEALTRPAVWSFWWPRFVRIAEDFIAEEHKRRARGIFPVATEVKAKLDLPGTPVPFRLTATADRIDRLQNGALDIIDYKTGGLPTAKQIAAGYAPQLPLEGFLAERGAFQTIKAAPVKALNFWQLKGADPVKRIMPIKDVEEKIAAAEDGLRKLIAVFSKPETPYLSQPRPAFAGYGDYDHLARVREWLSAEDNDSAGDPEDDPWTV